MQHSVLTIYYIVSQITIKIYVCIQSEQVFSVSEPNTSIRIGFYNSHM